MQDKDLKNLKRGYRSGWKRISAGMVVRSRSTSNCMGRWRGAPRTRDWSGVTKGLPRKWTVPSTGLHPRSRGPWNSLWSWAVLNFQSGLKVIGTEWTQGTIDWTGCQVDLTAGRGGRWPSGAATLPDLILAPPFLLLRLLGLSLWVCAPQTDPPMEVKTHEVPPHTPCLHAGAGWGSRGSPPTCLWAGKISAGQKTQAFFCGALGTAASCPTLPLPTQ